MSELLRQEQSENRILSHLSAQDFGLVESFLTAVDLPLRMQLEGRKQADRICIFH